MSMVDYFTRYWPPQWHNNDFINGNLNGIVKHMPKDNAL